MWEHPPDLTHVHVYVHHTCHVAREHPPDLTYVYVYVHHTCHVAREHPSDLTYVYMYVHHTCHVARGGRRCTRRALQYGESSTPGWFV